MSALVSETAGLVSRVFRQRKQPPVHSSNQQEIVVAKMTWDGRATFLRMLSPEAFSKAATVSLQAIVLDCVPTKSVSYGCCVIIGIGPTYQNRRSICLAARKLLKRSKAR